MKNRLLPKSLRLRILGSALLSLFTFVGPLFSQLPSLPGGNSTLLFETQTQIDDFAFALNNDVILGNVSVVDNGSDPITNLDGLSSLLFVFGNLTIEGNTELDRFCGLYQLINSNGLVGDFTVTGNLFNPTKVDITTAGECTEEAEIVLSFEEIIQAFVDYGLLNNGRANSLSKQASKSLKALLNHLNAFVNAGILSEDEAMLIYNAAVLEN